MKKNREFTSKKPSKNAKPTKDWFLWSIIIGSIILFLTGVKSDILNFDDNEYFENYPEVLNINWYSIKTYFSKFYVLMYQPLPILSFALTYHFFDFNPIPYHLVNILLHGFNIYLCYQFLKKWSQDIQITKIVTFAFAFHPFVVEPVMWISCRSSGLYFMFYVLGLIHYFNYKQLAQNKYLIYTFLFFLLSLFSKVHAITFPVIILLFDIFYFKDYKSTKNIISKIPFFLISIVFGLLALSNKETIGNISFSASQYGIIDNFFMLCYSACWYLFKTILPINLVAINVYPLKVNQLLPYVYYITPLVLIALAYFAIKLRHKFPYILFGLLFFYIGMSVTFQIIPSRLVIVADRYGYLPNLGLFFILASCVKDIYSGKLKLAFINSNSIKTSMYIIAIAWIFLSFTQIKIWKNNETLVTQIIEQNPETSYIGRAYGVRGNMKRKNNDLAGAEQDFKKAISLDTSDWIAYYNLGQLSAQFGDTNAMFNYFKNGNRYNTQSPIIFNELALYYIAKKNYTLAMQMADSGITRAKDFAAGWNVKGAIYSYINNPKDAIMCFDKSISLNPKFGEAYKNRGVVKYANLKDSVGGCNDIWQAKELKYPQAENLYNQYCKKFAK